MTIAAIHPKVGGSGIAGAASSVLIWLLGLTGLMVPAEIAASLTTLIMAGVAYAIPSLPSNENGK